MEAVEEVEKVEEVEEVEEVEKVEKVEKVGEVLHFTVRFYYCLLSFTTCYYVAFYKVRESSRRLEKVGEGWRWLEMVGEGWRRLDSRQPTMDSGQWTV